MNTRFETIENYISWLWN